MRDLDNDEYGDNTASVYACDDNDNTVHDTCDQPSICLLSIFPSRYSKLSAIIFPLQFFVITAGSSVSFEKPIDIDGETDAIEELGSLRFGGKLIFGVIFVRHSRFVAGEDTVTVSYGSPEKTACSKIKIKLNN